MSIDLDTTDLDTPFAETIARGGANSRAPAAHAEQPLTHSIPQTIIEPPKGWQLINARELWQYRELLGFLTWRDVKVRYKQTLLGASWAILQPAMMMVVFTIFFGRLAQVPTGDVPYPIFVYAGLLPWTFFATAIANAGNSVVGSERLITKIYFPRLAIPFASVGAAVVDFCCAVSLLALLMLWYGVAPTSGLLAVPLIFALIALAALGVGTLLAALNVAYRDFRYVIPFLVQIWMFATPTVYMQPESNGAGWIDTLLALNPLTGLVGGFRAAVLGDPLPWTAIGTSAAIVAAMFVAGCLYFRRVEDSFADII
jgi:lipopolysaccharide transport system permease protein